MLSLSLSLSLSVSVSASVSRHTPTSFVRITACVIDACARLIDTRLSICDAIRETALDRGSGTRGNPASRLMKSIILGEKVVACTLARVQAAETSPEMLENLESSSRDFVGTDERSRVTRIRSVADVTIEKRDRGARMTGRENIGVNRR